MAGDSKTNGKPVSYYIEWSYVKARSFVLNFLALGTMLMFYRVGTMIAERGFPTLPLVVWVMRVLFIGIAYYAIDWGLKIILTDASATAAPPSNVKDISGNKIEPGVRKTAYLWRVALFAVSITTGVSLTSNAFVSADLSGASHLPEYIRTVQREALRDSTMKMKAFNLLEAAPTLQSQMLKDARNQAQQILDAAVSTAKSQSWKNDYLAQQNNRQAWFWTCKTGPSCPRNYQAYRQRILDAEIEGKKLIADAGGYTQSITSSLSTTLSRTISGDSTMIQVKSAIDQLETERKARARTINLVLMIMTVAGAVLALVLTWLLRKHRILNGQLINDNPARFLMIYTDVFNRLRQVLSDILFTITFQPHKWALSNGYLRHYTIEHDNITANMHATVHTHKRCEWCDKPLIGKRSDAKYCSDEHRLKANAEKRAQKKKAVS